MVIQAILAFTSAFCLGWLIVGLIVHMRTKKKNALFGRYPSCDLLNNALRFLREGKTDSAISEIVFAIDKANGYFHSDNVETVEKARHDWKVKHKD